MHDSVVFVKLYSNVLEEEKYRNKRNVTTADIRAAIQNMTEVYRPSSWKSEEVVNIADYDDPAHRIAYLHKYSACHTGLAVYMLRWALSKVSYIRNSLSEKQCIKLCSLGAGPGTDVVAVLFVLHTFYGLVKFSATMIDCMPGWSDTFSTVVEELMSGRYGEQGKNFNNKYFSWFSISTNLLGPMQPDVHRAVSSADLITMVKFISAAACKDTRAMIKKVFKSMKNGAFVFFIDNAAGGFHELVNEAAQECSLVTVFGPVRHFTYSDSSFAIQRFGYTATSETKVVVRMWYKSVDGIRHDYSERGLGANVQVIGQAPPRSSNAARPTNLQPKQSDKDKVNLTANRAELSRASHRNDMPQDRKQKSRSRRNNNDGCCVIL